MADEIIVKYQADTGNHVQALKAIEDEQVKVEKGATAIGESSAKGFQKAAEGVKTFRQQIKEATLAYQQIAEKEGQFSKAAVDAQKNVAKLKDEYGDFQKTVEAFNPDRKFAIFGQALRGAASGFQGIIAAQALLGNQSQDLTRALLKVQGALALTDAINNVLEMGDTFKSLKAIILGELVPALSTLKGALVATGIGAAAVAVGFLVANWKKLAETFSVALPQLYFLKKATEDITESFDANIAASKKFSDAYKGIADKRLNTIQDAETREIAVAQERARREKQDVDRQQLDAKTAADYKQAIENDLQKNVSDIRAKYAKEAKDKRDRELKEAKRHQEELEKLQQTAFEKRIANLRKEQDMVLSADDRKTKSQYDAWREQVEIESQAYHKRLGDANRTVELDNKVREDNIQGAKDTATGLAEIAVAMYTFSGQNASAFAEFQKAIALVNIGSKTAEAVANVIDVATAPSADNIATGGFLIPGKIIAGIGLVLANVASAYALIKDTGAQSPVFNVPAFAKGVVDLNGPGTSTSDSIPARLSRGESVLTATATRSLKDEFKAANYSVVDYKNLIQDKYVKPAIEADRRKQKEFSDNIVYALNVQANRADKNIVKAIKDNKPASKKDFEKLTRSITETDRRGHYLNRRVV